MDGPSYTLPELEADIKKAVDIVKKRVDEYVPTQTPMKKIVGIDEASYAQFIGEIARLKPKKRKNWSRHLTDKYGTRSRVRYEDGKFLNWCPDVQKWCEAIPADRYTSREEKKKGSAEWIPNTYVGWVKAIGYEMNKMGYSKGVTEAMAAAGFERILEENLTGNHYRNHFVNVGQDIYG
jgi:hypothetical protein